MLNDSSLPISQAPLFDQDEDDDYIPPLPPPMPPLDVLNYKQATSASDTSRIPIQASLTPPLE